MACFVGSSKCDVGRALPAAAFSRRWTQIDADLQCSLLLSAFIRVHRRLPHNPCKWPEAYNGTLTLAQRFPVSFEAENQPCSERFRGEKCYEPALRPGRGLDWEISDFCRGSTQCRRPRPSFSRMSFGCSRKSSHSYDC